MSLWLNTTPQSWLRKTRRSYSKQTKSIILCSVIKALSLESTWMERELLARNACTIMMSLCLENVRIYLLIFVKARMNSNSRAHRMASLRRSALQLPSAQTSKTHWSLDLIFWMMLRAMPETIISPALGTTNTPWLRSNSAKERRISWSQKRRLVSTSNTSIKPKSKTRRRQESLVRKKWRFRTSSQKSVASSRNGTKQRSISS